MQQIRITRTSDLDNVLSFLKGRYPLLSEAEIIKMALSKQYYQEAQGGHMKREYSQDPTKRFTKDEWNKKFEVSDKIKARISDEDQEALEEAIDRAVKEVRAKN